MSTYTIGEVADRSGFSASALRYYEGIGLVPPPRRTDAGYRLYDDDSLSRLAFIARAKHLGCSLEEITDLVAVWDGTCEPVQRRFHELVTAKLAETDRQVAELRALRSQLAVAATQLAAPSLDGPCDGNCACMTVGKEARVTLPIYDATAPVACTITPDEVRARVELIERMRSNLLELERSEHGLTLHFPEDDAIEADLHRFVVDEKRCCEFWGFDVARDPSLRLRWDAPPAAAHLIDRLEAFFLGDDPALDLAGLL